MSLQDKTILITGAARRIGRSMAMSCAEHGANIVLHYHTSQKEVEETDRAIKELGRQSWMLKADLSDEKSLMDMFDQAAGFSKLFGLINSASIFKQVGFMDTTLSDWESHIRINLTAPFLLTQQFAKTYSLDETGRVLNLVDWRALRPGKDHFPYTITKSALVALTMSTALNLAPRIVVNAIALGAILPPEDEENNPDILKNVPVKRWADMDELLETVNFLLDGPSYITGEVIYLDGGRHLV